MINLLQELNNLAHQDNNSAKVDGTKYEHCSDFMSEDDGKIAHGHNEDWSNDVRPYVYFVAYHFTKESGRLPVAGLCYPGMVIGNAVKHFRGMCQGLRDTRPDHGLQVPSVKGEQRTKSTDWRQLRSDALPPVAMATISSHGLEIRRRSTTPFTLPPHWSPTCWTQPPAM
ncbi:hypothetical protein SARC_03788 [Sphaeroforma arctica JP610]|uniref:Uncharacterized protein n=1 Tax=Sphaeroforma arctica JP610 TaxID=667725 RepID=A0A0L0G6V8_9EUKA|nr:hypothetical protein SARC_03788 [Sphaeroforma arctica JP610]KNC83968.1 hypothetical protein SARC_03788 [Sphaeroforma arctica JP610]|eukprot:XP_014157870.1 hypothetical protein SARC_03788 [Sphaeroforma arctica JP610]